MANHARGKEVIAMVLPIHERIIFGERHPDLAEYTTEVFGTYGTCMGKAPTTADEAYLHIYGPEPSPDSSRCGCAWCRETVDRKIRHRKLFD